MPFPVDVYGSDIAQIVSDVFQTMIEAEVLPVGPPYAVRENTVTAAIFFAGTWRGAVLVECDEAQARRWTSRLMSIPEPDTFTDDVRDAMGEIVNMVGGNLKSVLPHGVALSMPSVVQGRSYSLRVCGSNMVNHQGFVTADGPFWVTLVEVPES
jgi:chemotaxis protein CheX